MKKNTKMNKRVLLLLAVFALIASALALWHLTNFSPEQNRINVSAADTTHVSAPWPNEGEINLKLDSAKALLKNSRYLEAQLILQEILEEVPLYDTASRLMAQIQSAKVLEGYYSDISDSIVPTAVNVFYRGVDNPIEVSAPGFASENLNVTATNGSISGAAGKYNIRPGEGTTSTIRVTAKAHDGSIRDMGSADFRVESLPKPRLQIGGYPSGSKVAIEDLIDNPITPVPKGPIKADYKVTSFRMPFRWGTRIRRNNKAYGDTINKQMKNYMSNLPRGSVIRYTNIQVQGPEGAILMPAIYYTIR